MTKSPALHAHIVTITSGSDPNYVYQSDFHSMYLCEDKYVVYVSTNHPDSISISVDDGSIEPEFKEFKGACSSRVWIEEIWNESRDYITEFKHTGEEAIYESLGDIQCIVFTSPTVQIAMVSAPITIESSWLMNTLHKFLVRVAGDASEAITGNAEWAKSLSPERWKFLENKVYSYKDLATKTWTNIPETRIHVLLNL